MGFCIMYIYDVVDGCIVSEEAAKSKAELATPPERRGSIDLEEERREGESCCASA